MDTRIVMASDNTFIDLVNDKRFESIDGLLYGIEKKGGVIVSVPKFRQFKTRFYF